MLADNLEAQSAGNRRHLDKLDRDGIAKTMRCRSADEGARGLFETEIFLADGSCRDEAIGAGLVKFHE
jgi:hypothetical protein